MALGSGQRVGESVETHEFLEKDGVTTMRITQMYDSKAARDQAIALGMDQGMKTGLAQLDRVLATAV